MRTCSCSVSVSSSKLLLPLRRWFFRRPMPCNNCTKKIGCLSESVPPAALPVLARAGLLGLLCLGFHDRVIGSETGQGVAADQGSPEATIFLEPNMVAMACWLAEYFLPLSAIGGVGPRTNMLRLRSLEETSTVVRDVAHQGRHFLANPILSAAFLGLADQGSTATSTSFAELGSQATGCTGGAGRTMWGLPCRFCERRRSLAPPRGPRWPSSRRAPDGTRMVPSETVFRGASTSDIYIYICIQKTS